MTDFDLLLAKQRLEDTGKFKVFRKVREHILLNKSGAFNKRAAIIDTETTGLDHKTCEIIELGMVIFEYSAQNTFEGVYFTYNGLQEPKNKIPKNITKITGIDDKIVKGKKIDWELVDKQLQECDLVICHNAAFDRKFLESQSPIKDTFKDMVFGCTKNDIDWKERGYGNNKLDYLNWAMGYFYDAHRAVNDCWATLNLLTAEDGALEELLNNCEPGETHYLYATGAPYEQKDLLRQRGYTWNDGTNGNPKAWYKQFKNDQDIKKEHTWLRDNIYFDRVLPKTVNATITLKDRYSERAK